jgi:endonuclease YncB( thermonuclease family)
VGQRRRIFARKPHRRQAGRGLAVTGILAMTAIGIAGCVQLAASIALPAGNTQTHLASENVAVIDGGTLRLSGQVVHLAGVATPPSGEACRQGDCAAVAALRLAALVRDQRVACTVNGTDSTGRAVARCQAGGKDIASAITEADNINLRAAD